MDVPTLTRRLAYSKKQTSYAWAKYYSQTNERLTADYRHYNVVARTAEGIPEHIKQELLAMATELKKQWECPICMDMIKPDTLEITNCGHYFCKDCLTKHKQSGADCRCPNCRRKINTD